ncbi:trypsin iota-like [Bradysia coprophila]|uniref:trypsin iota-like n=1 Tax=Bradysia coprophila TaxID=38358 RepID=UPI00187D8EFA|nr:trypsin iota-like [Bradysia coprophila]
MFLLTLKYVSKVICLSLLFLAIPCRCPTDSNSEADIRILHGITADELQFPYQVSLQKHRKHLCGGSIISDVKVLTAGHCVTDENGARIPTALFAILAGTTKLNVEKPIYLFLLKQISIHPKFDHRTVQYDYAVVFINGLFDFRLSERVAAIALATQNPTPGTICYLSGWGDVQEDMKIRIPNDLQFARITIDPPEVCAKEFGIHFSPEQMLCAGRTNNENAGCGDSGGPLYCKNELCGIVSFGNEFYDSKSPDVYSSVAYVFDWINTTDGTTNCSSKDIVKSLHVVIISFFLLLVSNIILLKQT